jgi:hypothetical protein
MEIVILLVVVAVAALFVSAPLRRGRPRAERVTFPEHAELQAAKEAKYREIRDAELDYRTGKLSREDWETADSTLRAEAIALLRRLDDAGAEHPPSGG